MGYRLDGREAHLFECKPGWLRKVVVSMAAEIWGLVLSVAVLLQFASDRDMESLETRICHITVAIYCDKLHVAL
jgi:hypothetical protein